MRERTNLAIIAEADSKSVQEARKVLKDTKEKHSKFNFVELDMMDNFNTVVLVEKKKFDKKGESYFRKKYKKIFLYKDNNEVVSRNIRNFGECSSDSLPVEGE